MSLNACTIVADVAGMSWGDYKAHCHSLPYGFFPKLSCKLWAVWVQLMYVHSTHLQLPDLYDDVKWKGHVDHLNQIKGTTAQ